MKYFILLIFPFFLFSQNNSGCTDSLYQEYSYLATTDDGSCQTLINCENDCSLIGDVNCNGVLDGTDAFLISQWIVGLYNLPCEQSMSGLNPDQLQEIVDLMEGQLNINYSGNSTENFNILFPDGYDGTAITWDLINDYTVPAGKNLCITNLLSIGTNDILIDGVRVTWSDSNYSNSRGSFPYFVSEGQVVSSNYSGGNVTTFNGFLSNKKVDPITWDLSNNYTVPVGKSLCISNLLSIGSNSIFIDGVRVSWDDSNNYNTRGSFPYFAYEGQVISSNISSEGFTSFNGYLIDEDFFSNSNASLSNSTNNSNIGGSQITSIEEYNNSYEIISLQNYPGQLFHKIKFDENSIFAFGSYMSSSSSFSQYYPLGNLEQCVDCEIVNNGYKGFYVFKYDQNGNIIDQLSIPTFTKETGNWFYSYNQTDENSKVVTLDVDFDLNGDLIVLIGNQYDDGYFEDIRLLRIDQSLNLISEKIISSYTTCGQFFSTVSFTNQSKFKIEVNDNNIYIAGRSTESINNDVNGYDNLLDPSVIYSDKVSVIDGIVINNLLQDAYTYICSTFDFLLKYDSNFDLIWIQNNYLTSFEEEDGVVVSSSTGEIKGINTVSDQTNIFFQPSSNSSISNIGYKLDSSGQLVDSLSISGNFALYDVFYDENNNSYLIGYSSSDLIVQNVSFSSQIPSQIGEIVCIKVNDEFQVEIINFGIPNGIGIGQSIQYDIKTDLLNQEFILLPLKNTSLVNNNNIIQTSEFSTILKFDLTGNFISDYEFKISNVFNGNTDYNSSISADYFSFEVHQNYDGSVFVFPENSVSILNNNNYIQIGEDYNNNTFNLIKITD